jgi:hypothetical protein
VSDVVIVELPCGYVRTGKLKEHLAHYRACSHPFCKERLAAWEAIVSRFLADERGDRERGRIQCGGCILRDGALHNACNVTGCECYCND